MTHKKLPLKKTRMCQSLSNSLTVRAKLIRIGKVPKVRWEAKTTAAAAGSNVRKEPQEEETSMISQVMQELRKLSAEVTDLKPKRMCNKKRIGVDIMIMMNTIPTRDWCLY